eukprot:CAMPEP_0113835440 /NCGR_PEP_ID=MMETSP0328-20130328/8943_1 /TAXON_ID=39455 /ORGANISM="Alexandrium minutum" /LENGTH=119 /DNA_ID=CAMNT_0000803779 /DNA_START=15 /DNA_END=374 /DNA_ORIENTATION=- /assembly_acc=CAM_ASM_000350
MKAMKAVMKKSGAMKAMKAMKAKKVMRSKSMIGKGKLAKSMVYKGAKKKTVGGLKASDITKNKYGKYVSKKASARGKTNVWAKAIAAARKALGLKGFVLINKGPEGKALYAKAKSIMGK